MSREEFSDASTVERYDDLCMLCVVGVCLTSDLRWVASVGEVIVGEERCAHWSRLFGSVISFIECWRAQAAYSPENFRLACSESAGGSRNGWIVRHRFQASFNG